MFSAVGGFRSTVATTFAAYYGNSTSHGSLAVWLYNDGNVIVGGTQANVPVIKTDFSGYITREVELTGDANSFPIITRDIDVDTSGNIYITGQSFGANTFNDAMIVKTDSNLDIIWQKRIYSGSSNVEVAWSGAIDSTSNVYIGGTVDNTIAVLAKFDSTGNVIFSKQFANCYRTYSVEVDNSDNYYTLTANTITGGTDGFNIEKWYSNGTQIWGTTITPTYGDALIGSESFAVEPNGNSYVSFSDNSGAPNFFSEYRLCKFDNSGSELWTKNFYRNGNTSQDVNIGPMTTDGSNLYVIPNLTVADTGNLRIMKLDPDGNTVWERVLSKAGSVDYPECSSITWANGYIALSGGTGNSITTKMSLVKLRDDGSGTGVYGNYTYSADTQVLSGANTITAGSKSDDSSSYSLTIDDSTFTSDNGVFSSTITYL